MDSNEKASAFDSTRDESASYSSATVAKDDANARVLGNTALRAPTRRCFGTKLKEDLHLRHFTSATPFASLNLTSAILYQLKEMDPVQQTND